MKRFHEAMARHSRGEKGQGMTEYIIIVAIIAIGAIVIIGLFGDAIRSRFDVALNILMGTGNTSENIDAGAADIKKSWNNWTDVNSGGGGS